MPAAAARAATTAGAQERRTRGRAPAKRIAPPLEHRILMTATLCLLALGAVMVYSSSAPIGVLAGQGLGTGEFVRYLIFGAVGLVGMHVLARRGLSIFTPKLVTTMVLVSFCLLLAVLVPHVGVTVNGARRWFAAGPIQFQPSELMKLSLVLYVARFLADHPKRMRSFKQIIMPIAIVTAPSALLILIEPDMGTTLVIAFTVIALLIGAGVPMRYLAILVGVGCGVALLFVLAQPYQMARLTSFLHPWSSKSTAGFQEVQGQISLGSGGLFGVGLGRGVQKIFYLPEAQTDFILAVIGEELGVLGIFGVVFLYGLIAYAGLRTARRAAGRYAKLLATGLTSLILCQGILNIFVVLGLAPLTGVPLPFISYAPTNLCIMLAAVGLLLNIAHPGARRLQSVDEPRRDAGPSSDRGGRDRRPRRSGAGGSRRATR
ncbi:MAG TPA: putative lipid II flippase FtsW [Solirubrobacteraceae bacterium]|jgi:cell division protein FtsW|nr:putative lipid II flippase FtsW [Solirubrobacteraceae bacterium]